MFHVSSTQDAHAHFDWDSIENRGRRVRVIPTLCGYTGVDRAVVCVLDFVLMRQLLGVGPREWLHVRRTDAALELHSRWIITCRVRFSGLERNAMRWEQGCIKRTRMSPTPCEFCSMTVS